MAVNGSTAEWAPAIAFTACRSSLNPVDRFVAAYNLLLGALWLSVATLTSYAVWAAAAHLAASLLPAVLKRVPRQALGPLRSLRELYPILLMPVFWTEIDLLFPLRHTGTFDRPISLMDEGLFGIHLGAEWMPAMPQMWLSEVMHFSYFAYYAAVYLPPVIMGITGRMDAARDMVFRLTVAYLSCYLVYLFFPVDGPHFLLEHYDGELTGGLFYQLVDVTQRAGDSRGCTFPSSHVAGAVTAAVIAWRWLPRPLAILLSLEAAGVVCSTIYTQNHYAIDSVAGLTWTLTLQLLLVPVLLRRLDRRRRGLERKAYAEPREIPIPVLWTDRSERRQRWAA
jgi:membrane-associated phospholipid phosphatase